MTTRVILVRHGNTFDAHEKPVWVGARTDLPLVSKGRDQASLMGEAFKATDQIPTTIFSGPLKRTIETAELMMEKLGIDLGRLQIDTRLREIDYGTWEGRSTEELIAMGEGEALKAWNEESVFPVHKGWQPVEGQIIADIDFLLSEFKAGTHLVVTSNGILRFFCAIASNRKAVADRKVATGHICVMEQKDKGSWEIVAWNVTPDQFKEHHFKKGVN